MKKVLITSFLFSALAFGLTGCLKDKGFQNNQYGINDPDNSPAGVGFPEAENEINVKGVEFVATAQTIKDPLVSLFAGAPASKDIKVTLAYKPSLVSDYNTANGTNLIAPPAGSVNIPSLVVTIPAGKRTGTITINVPNALNTLSPLSSYALGFTIASVDDPNIKIAENFKDILVGISVKNKYDGVYKLKVRMRAPANDRPTVNTSSTWTWPWQVHLITTGANTVKLFDAGGFVDYIQPIQTAAGAWSGFGQTAPKFGFDLSTDLMTSAVNDVANPTNGRAFQIDPAVTTSKLDPNTHNVYASFIMTQPGFQPLYIADTFTYVGPR